MRKFLFFVLLLPDSELRLVRAREIFAVLLPRAKKRRGTECRISRCRLLLYKSACPPTPCFRNKVPSFLSSLLPLPPPFPRVLAECLCFRRFFLSSNPVTGTTKETTTHLPSYFSSTAIGGGIKPTSSSSSPSPSLLLLLFSRTMYFSRRE